MIRKNFLGLFVIIFGLNIKAAKIDEQNIFDKRLWDGQTKSFTHFRCIQDNVVRSINGAGILPVVSVPGKGICFLLAVAIVEGGTDEHIGQEPVYINPSNYPKIDPKARELYKHMPFETSIEMAARPEELSIIRPYGKVEKAFTADFFISCITENSRLLPNAGMCYGKYAVPTYLTYLGRFNDLEDLIADVNSKIESIDYNLLFPTESTIARTDRIIKFELVPAPLIIKAIQEQAGQRIESPLTINNCEYKLSPYLARTIALDKNCEIAIEFLSTLL